VRVWQEYKYLQPSVKWTIKLLPGFDSPRIRIYSLWLRSDRLSDPPSLVRAGYPGICPLDSKAVRVWTWPFVSSTAEVETTWKYSTTPTVHLSSFIPRHGSNFSLPPFYNGEVSFSISEGQYKNSLFQAQNLEGWLRFKLHQRLRIYVGLRLELGNLIFICAHVSLLSLLINTKVLVVS
jgi:hypothetical protein